MPFKLSLVTDVRSWLKGTADIEQSLEDVADSLDDLARDTARDAEQASDQLEKSFSQAFDTVARDAKQAGRKLDDGISDGARKAEEGLDELKDEASQSAREAAASFSGEFEDVADLIQETLANALSGFGPIGAAAGVAAAAGIGLLISHLETAADEATDAKQAVIDLADQLADVEGNPAALEWADLLRQKLNEITDDKAWFEFWQDQPRTRLEEWTAAAGKYGVAMSDVVKAQTNDADALARVNEQLTAEQARLNRAYLDSIDQMGNYDESLRWAADDAAKFRDQIAAGAQQVSDAVEMNRLMSAALNDVTQKQQEQAATADAQAEAQRRVADAQAEAQRASQQWSDALTDHLSVADEGLDRFVKDGRLNLKAWADELKARAKDNQTVQDFAVTIAPKLSPEALENFSKLSTETQTQIAKAYDTGSKKDRKKVIANLEAEAKITSVQLDTKAAQDAATASPIEVPTTIVTANLPGDIRAAADHAQHEANQRSNEIRFTATLDDDDLQRQVNNAVARITTPVIYATVKPRKEVP